MFEVDANGFDHMDRRLLLAIIEKFDGGPVGAESLAAAIGEDRDTIEDVIEPCWIRNRKRAICLANSDGPIKRVLSR